MRFGYMGSKDLEGYATLKDWLLAQVDAAALTAPAYEEIVFILPLVGTRYRLIDSDNLPAFRKGVSKCVGLGVQATRHAKRQAGVI